VCSCKNKGKGGGGKPEGAANLRGAMGQIEKYDHNPLSTNACEKRGFVGPWGGGGGKTTSKGPRKSRALGVEKPRDVLQTMRKGNEGTYMRQILGGGLTQRGHMAVH